MERASICIVHVREVTVALSALSGIGREGGRERGRERERERDV